VKFAERTREMVERTSFTPSHGGVTMTASIGVASYPAPDVASVSKMRSVTGPIRRRLVIMRPSSN